MKIRKLILLLLLFTLSSCTISSLRPNYSIPIPQREIEPGTIKVALVLGGGGSRGLAHVGVIEELTKAGIPIDLVVGSSAGAIVGCIYADQLDVPYLKKCLCHLKSADLLDYAICGTRYGLVEGFRLKRFLSRHLCASTFEELQIPFIAVTTDLCKGTLTPLGAGRLVPAIHASCAVPGMFRPVKLYGRYFVDGAVIDPIPVQTARDNGAEIVIAVDISTGLPEDMPKHLFGVMYRCFEICYLRVTHFTTRNADVIIKPELKCMGMFCDTANQDVYDAGVEAAKAAIPYIKRLIEDRLQYDQKISHHQNPWEG